RRRALKEQLLYTAVGTSLDTVMAIGALEGVLGDAAVPVPSAEPDAVSPAWKGLAVALEQALFCGNALETREQLKAFVSQFQDEPLLFTALAEGGSPRQVLRVRIAQSVLRALVASLPRLGLLRETYQLLAMAREMEQKRPVPGRGVT